MRIKKNIKYLSIITALFIVLSNHASATSLSFSAGGGSQTTNVNFPPVAWSLSSCPSWLSVSPTSGTSAVEVTFTCSENTSTSSRSGTVIFYSPVGNISVPVTQEGAEPYLNIRTLSFWLSSSARTLSITVSSNTSWTVSESSSWLAVSPTSGSGSGSFSISITENTSTSLRSASVTVSGGGGITKPISINQEGDVPVTHTIQSSAGSGGSISPSGYISVNDGSSQTFTITPSTGYHISNVNIDGALKGALSTYTFSNVTTGHYINASFAINTYTITASAGSGGSISSSGSVSVNYGSSKSYTITPSSGYEISDVVVDGISQGAISSYTFSNVTSNHTISASFGISPPSTPAGFYVEMVTAYVIDLLWDPVSGADGYNVYRSSSSGGTYSYIGSNNSNSEYEDEDVEPGTTYYYKVSAYNSYGESELAGPISGTTLVIPYPTPSITSITTLSSSSIKITWTDINEERSYGVSRANSLDDYFVVIGSTEADVTEYIDTDLSPNTKYYYKIIASNANGHSPYSEPDSAFTLLSTPSGFYVEMVTAYGIDLLWGPVSGADGYNVYRSTSSGGTYSYIGSNNSNSEYEDEDVEPGTTYYYKISAYNSYGESEPAGPISGTTLVIPYPTPSITSITTLSSSSIKITWTDVNEERSYGVSRANSLDDYFVVIGSTEADVTEYIDTDLSPNTKYYYKIIASNANGHSPYSEPDSALTLLSTPSGFYVEMVTAYGIDLLWGPVSGADGYNVYRSTSSGGTYSYIGSNNSNSEYEDVEPGTTYYYKVSAYNSYGESEPAGPISGTTLVIPYPTPSITSITTLSIGSIKITWSDINEEDRYNITRATNLEDYFAAIGSTGADVTEYTDTSAAPNTKYYYKIIASNANGHSPYSEPDSSVTFSGIPQSFIVEIVSYSSIDLLWDSIEGALGYNVYRSDTETGTYSLIGTNTKNEYEDIDLPYGTTYYYKVSSYTSGGESPKAGPIEGTTKPSRPLNVQVSVDSVNSSINITWESVYGASGYKIHRAIKYTGDDSLIADVGDSVLEFTDQNISSLDTNYCYTVYAYNAGGNSRPSTTACSIIDEDLPEPIDSLEAFTLTSQSIKVTWYNPNSENGFRIYRDTLENGNYELLYEATLPVNKYSLIDDELEPNTTYYYKMSAYNAAGESELVGPVSATTLAAGDFPVKIMNFDPPLNEGREPLDLKVYYKITFPGTLKFYSNDSLYCEEVKEVEGTYFYIFNNLKKGLKTIKIELYSINGDYTDIENYEVHSCRKKTIKYDYDNMGNIIEITADSLFTFKYEYDSQGRLDKVKTIGPNSTETLEADYTYNNADQVSNLQPGNLQPVTYGYNTDRGWLETITHGADAFSENLTYFKNGNIETQTISNTAFTGGYTYTYVYDDMNRLTNANTALTDATESYTYNDDGSILTKISTDKEMTYTYASGKHRLKKININGSDSYYAYDHKGNIYGGDGILMEYNFRNQPTAMTNMNLEKYLYTYNSSGERIEKIKENDSTTAGTLSEGDYYLRDYTGRELVIYDNKTGEAKSANIYGNGLVGRIEINETEEERFYYLKDHLGSIRTTLDEYGAIVSAQDYYPYGEIIRNYINGVLIDKYKFTEKERDEESGYDYLLARYYDSKLGMWLSVDPLAHLRPGLSPYNYVQNNPLIRFDPTGMFDEGTEDKISTGYPAIDYILALLQGQLQQTKDNAETTIKEAPEKMVKAGIKVADVASDASTLVAFGGILFAPVTEGASLVITAKALTAGTIADASSTVLKGTDAAFFDGSTDAFTEQAIKLAINVGGGRLLDNVATKVVTRTGLNNVLFRSASTKRFVSNSFGYTVEAVRDATKISIGFRF